MYHIHLSHGTCVPYKVEELNEPTDYAGFIWNCDRTIIVHKWMDSNYMMHDVIACQTKYDVISTLHRLVAYFIEHEIMRSAHETVTFLIEKYAEYDLEAPPDLARTIDHIIAKVALVNVAQELSDLRSELITYL